MKTTFKELPPSLEYSFIVKEEVAPQFAAPFHFHDGFEFTYIVKGRGKFYGGNQVMNFSEGDVYFFGPSFSHYFVNEKSFIQSEEIGHSIIIQFHKDFLGTDFFQKPELRRVLSFLKMSHLGIKIVRPLEEMKIIFTQLLLQFGIKRIILLLKLFDELVSLKSKDIIILSQDLQKTPESIKDLSKLDAVYRYVLERFKEDINSKEAASLSCLNEAAFCRYFKRQTKKTFSQFVNEIRVAHATYLLQDTGNSIMDICFESGFKNLSYFNRQFKQYTNNSPLNYRKEILNNLF
jgi:AraC-like DNA-binding protein